MNQPIRCAYTISDILATLDEADLTDPYNWFFDLEHPYFYTAGSAITLFADETRWAMVFEKTGFSPRAGYPEMDLYYFGNCLQNLDKAGLDGRFTCNVKFLPLIPFELIDELTEEYDLIKRSVKSVMVHGNSVSINQDPDAYEKRGIELSTIENPNRLIDYRSLVRYWADTEPESLLAPESDLRTCLPDDLPRLMRIDEWHHKQYSPEYNLGEKPSSYETYRMMAEVIAQKDTTHWKPTLKSNNAWRNWPEAGSL
jgi:hypothetical protein